MSRPLALPMAGARASRQHIWEAIRRQPRAFAQRDLVAASGQPVETVAAYLKALAAAGLVARDQPGRRRDHATWTLLRDEGADHPRLNSRGERTLAHRASENLWRSLRILGGELSAADLAHSASVGEVSVSERRARRYLDALAEAGYLIRTQVGHGDPASYRLLASRDTGPRPPVVGERASLQVYDPNLDRVVLAKTRDRADEDVADGNLEPRLQRLRELLGQWLRQADGMPADDLVRRTRLELDPFTFGALQ